ncbi:uncharacterized protein L3040_006711 [Drepanopeziza brunnea f. sp. 'multigermtubi']|uniref:uncharacterized protein n=1 Tax=Drepanopeziza brunnea f. sp. 'multigermtubi' TaxID=698441 RepID=UPI00239D6735|nr:hypothetical protein L3040_006711 [Drepanopeziza brunnea f. sp. 'multigermtubi']
MFDATPESWRSHGRVMDLAEWAQPLGIPLPAPQVSPSQASTLESGGAASLDERRKRQDPNRICDNEGICRPTEFAILEASAVLILYCHPRRSALRKSIGKGEAQGFGRTLGPSSSSV